MKKLILLILLFTAQFAFSQTGQKENQQSPNPSAEIYQSESKPGETPDTPADYPGGMNALRKDISQLFDSSKFEYSSGIFKSMTKFDVNPDGSISSISTTGNSRTLNKEMDRVMKSLKTKWIPATKNGQSIKSTYQIPMTMNR
ncbi:hypothetical protein [Chryseobacterium jejuense]|uniref:hypothetical protein n=1 Tax=Chryseobacterium jejuense TaxID=445960 RepID=UPI001AE9CEF1|nr:hypothetical protein [Chryseobacterium jejuense]MBP2617373.1 hypothetical protein [Chryseobacterium jejuense]